MFPTELKYYKILFNNSNSNFLICYLIYETLIFRSLIRPCDFKSCVLNINNIENIIKINSVQTENFYTINIHQTCNNFLVLKISYLNDFADYDEEFIFEKIEKINLY